MGEGCKDKGIVGRGGGKGMGRGSATAFAQEGGSVAVADISEADGKETVQQITSSGGRAIYVKCDVAKTGDVQRLVQETVKAFGGADVLHNNASHVKFSTVDDMPADQWGLILRIDF